MTATTLKDEVLGGLLVAPRTWRAYFIQSAVTLVLAVVAITILALLTDLSVGTMALIVLAALALSAAVTAQHVRREERRR